MEKQQERNNLNNDNIDDSHTNNEKSFLKENNQTSEKQLHSLHYHTKGSKVKKLLNPSRQP